MTTVDRTAYPRFREKKPITKKELVELYTPSEKEITFVQKNANGLKNQFHLMLFLKSFQRLGYFVPIKIIPDQIINHIMKEMSVSISTLLECSHSTKMRHYDRVRTYLDVSSYGKLARRAAIKIAFERASIIDHPADLVNIVVEELINQKYELPAFSTIDRLVRHVRHRVNSNLHTKMIAALSGETKDVINEIFIKEKTDHTTEYNRLKQIPKNPTLYHLKDLLNQLKWLMSFGDIEQCLTDIPVTKIQCFASEAKVLDASEMKDLGLKKQIALTVCLIYQARVENRDHIVKMFIRRLSKIHKNGKNELELIKERHRERSENLINTLGNMLKTFASKEENVIQKWQSLQATLANKGGTEHLLQEYEEVSAYNDNNYLPLLSKFFKSYRATLFLLIKSLDIKSTTQDNSLIKAMLFMIDNEKKRVDYLPIDSDEFLSFASNKWRSCVLKKENGKWFANRRQLEVCIFSCLASEIQSLDLYIEGSESFADYRKQLLSMEECEKLIPEYCKAIGISDNASNFISELKKLLTDTARKADKEYPKNTYLEIDDNGTPVLKKLKTKKATASAKKLEKMILDRMPDRNILDVLVNVIYWVNFTRHFGPQSGSLPKIVDEIERYVITVFAYGCNLGATQTARHLNKAITPHMILFTNKRHINAKKLEQALQDTIDAYNLFDLPKVWGKSNVGIADGTQISLHERNLMAESHIRYGGYGGIAYHHISDTYIALFSHFISCGVWEAVYIIEGLLKNKSDIQIETVHADTQGQSSTVFAISYLLGIQLEPRIRNWKDLIFYRPNKNEAYKHIDSLFSEAIDWDLIETHVKDMFQVVLSIKAGKISSAVLLQKLGNYSKKNKLYQAFRELGRVIRTIFLLRYISDDKKRQNIISSTSKIESYNQFSQWFSFGSLGVITSNYFDEQEKAIKYNDLIANSAMLQNVADMSAIIQDLKKSGVSITDEDLEYLSPYTNNNLKRFGSYAVDASKRPPDLANFTSLSMN